LERKRNEEILEKLKAEPGD